MKIAVGSDHCGFALKMEMLPWLQEEHEVKDFGCYSTEMADFPVISQKVCDQIVSGKETEVLCSAAQELEPALPAIR